MRPQQLSKTWVITAVRYYSLRLRWVLTLTCLRERDGGGTDSQTVLQRHRDITFTFSSLRYAKVIHHFCRWCRWEEIKAIWREYPLQKTKGGCWLFLKGVQAALFKEKAFTRQHSHISWLENIIYLYGGTQNVMWQHLAPSFLHKHSRPYCILTWSPLSFIPQTAMDNVERGHKSPFPLDLSRHKRKAQPQTVGFKSFVSFLVGLSILW